MGHRSPSTPTSRDHEIGEKNEKKFVAFIE
jgi:hypothetical protein